MNNRNNIKTFIFFDCETTGLPHLENNKTRITELSLVAVQSSNIALGVYPRVMNKLTLCLNPGKLVSSDSTDLTGLCNFSLEHQSFFNSTVVETIQNFIETNKKPVCLVAHNGFQFDYPILKAEILKTGNCLADDLLCIDSLDAFRSIHFKDLDEEILSQRNKQVNDPTEKVTIQNDNRTEEVFNNIESVPKKLKVWEIQKKNETTPQKQKILAGNRQFFNTSVEIPKTSSCTDIQKIFNTSVDTPKTSNFIASENSQITSTVRNNLHFDCRGLSFKLVDVYRRLTKREPQHTHEAEGDVLILIHCAATLGEKFVDWANIHCVLFKDIEPMTPGKKIRV